MPTISMFYGLIIRMYFFDDQRHSCPHIHVYYQDDSAVIAIPDGELLEGKLPSRKLKLVQAWIELRQEDLMTDWALATQGEELFTIEPLK